MRSHLLEGKVSHLRTSPFTYRLDHAVFYFALDLSELDEVTRSLRLVSRNRPNVLASGMTTTWTRRRGTWRRRSASTCATRAWTPTAGG